MIFDTQKACKIVQESYERLSDKAGRHNPAEIFIHGHIDTAYFIPCTVILDEQ